LLGNIEEEISVAVFTVKGIYYTVLSFWVLGVMKWIRMRDRFDGRRLAINFVALEMPHIIYRESRKTSLSVPVVFNLETLWERHIL